MPYDTEEERRDFARQMVNLLKTNAEELTANLNTLAVENRDSVAVAVENLNTLLRRVDQNLEAAYRAATKASQESTEAAYKGASATVDLVVGLVGKDHELAKALRGLRR